MDREIDDVDAGVVELAQDAAQGRDVAVRGDLQGEGIVAAPGSRRAPAAASCVAVSAKLSSMRPPGILCLSSCALPCATMRPRSRIATRSASSSASSRYCVVRNTVVPSPARLADDSYTARRLRGSRPVVGSSRKMTCGAPISVIARSSRRRIPPE